MYKHRARRWHKHVERSGGVGILQWGAAPAVDQGPKDCPKGSHQFRVCCIRSGSLGSNCPTPPPPPTPPPARPSPLSAAGPGTEGGTALKELCRERYGELTRIFDYYASLSGDAFTISLNEWGRIMLDTNVAGVWCAVPHCAVLRFSCCGSTP